ncbi:glycosyltransferase family 4 protein [Halorussus sp. MSC15.2]|uniref:glycosyltransferase family 4 protein n=1 Tax=Halorussus sp. MSC15.2 TaxID=2283638 RepID=UPI0013D88F4A|nr:glycosyltransferase family 4 protein [Halorussus sp. MSC15.2]NEU58242.1 glycosyltransferase family 4 protein [Halorussus sp. MSC15.2]
MRVLVAAHDFYPDPGSGGTGRYVYETTKRLADRGHDVSVLTRRRGDVPARETVSGVRVARYDLDVAERSAPEIAARLPGAVRAVRDHFDALPDPDLVSLQGTVTDLLADLLVPEDVPRSATFHSPWPTEYRIRAGHADTVSGPRRGLNAALRRRIERSTLASCERVLALSEFMAGKLREVHGPVADPVVVPGGVDAERYRPDAGVYDSMRSANSGESVGASESVPTYSSTPETSAERAISAAVESEGGDVATDFLTVRRLSPRMGHGMLLRAFARVARERPDVHLHVAGDGPLREELERTAADLGVADRVTFLGYVPDEDLPGAYATADCFVLPTRRLEGFGLATLEALASGTPVVATPVGGTTEILSGLREDPRVPTEMVVESVAPDSLADRMAAWADLAPARRDAAGRACREHARENYAWDRTADAIAAEYREIA